MKTDKNTAPKRILIVNVNWIGDTIFATPFIRNLRETCPDSYIAVLTHRRCKDVLSGNPRLNEIILYDEKGGDANIFRKIKKIFYIRSKKFDTVFILRKSLSRTLLVFLAGIPERIGYSNKKSGFFLSRIIPEPAVRLHRAEYFMGLIRGIGAEPKKTDCEFFISDNDRAEAARILSSNGLTAGKRFVAMNPGGNWAPKRWPPDYFVKLGDRITSELKKEIVLTGSEKDTGLCGQIASGMVNKPIMLCGKTDLKTLAAVFEKSDWVVSGDSGPAHIAAGVKARVLALFGPTSVDITGPYTGSSAKILRKDTGCEIPCYNPCCADNRCMKAVTVDDAIKAMS